MGKFIVFLGLFVLVACGGTPSAGPPSCTVGETVACFCTDGRQGVRRCELAPSGPFLTRCDCPPLGSCAAATSCASCTPLMGCGWCGATGACVAVNASCTGPSAGACGSGWACQSTDCPDSRECRPCGADSDCVSGMCRARTCDGARACVPLGRAPICETVGGMACPVVSAYRACTDDGQCGPRARCLPVWPGQSARVCTPSCTTAADCPGLTVPGGVGIPFCASAMGTCAMGCSREGACDTGLTCRRDVTGSFAFCL